jgi:hypothetical protein
VLDALMHKHPRDIPRRPKKGLDVADGDDAVR